MPALTLCPLDFSICEDDNETTTPCSREENPEASPDRR